MPSRPVACVLAIMVASNVAACGGAASPPHEPEGHEHAGHEGEHEDGHHGEHGALPGPVNDFHEVLAPLWHAPKGPERANATCGKVMDLNTKASAITTAPAPSGVTRPRGKPTRMRSRSR